MIRYVETTAVSLRHFIIIVSFHYIIILTIINIIYIMRTEKENEREKERIG